jgi:hypothetical protein
MGDRTHVTITVLKEQAEETKKIFDTNGSTYYQYDLDEPGDHAHFLFAEVNYGELPDLVDLEAAGIAYTSHWDAGSE